MVPTSKQQFLLYYKVKTKHLYGATTTFSLFTEKVKILKIREMVKYSWKNV